MSPHGTFPATPPAAEPANTAIRSTSRRGLLIKPRSAPACAPTTPPTGTAMDTSQAPQPSSCHRLCATPIPAAPPSSIQKAIINRGANGGGVDGVKCIPSAACLALSMNELRSNCRGRQRQHATPPIRRRCVLLLQLFRQFLNLPFHVLKVFREI